MAPETVRGSLDEIVDGEVDGGDLEMTTQNKTTIETNYAEERENLGNGEIDTSDDDDDGADSDDDDDSEEDSDDDSDEETPEEDETNEEDEAEQAGDEQAVDETNDETAVDENDVPAVDEDAEDNVDDQSRLL